MILDIRLETIPGGHPWSTWDLLGPEGASGYRDAYSTEPQARGTQWSTLALNPIHQLNHSGTFQWLLT